MVFDSSPPSDKPPGHTSVQAPGSPSAGVLLTNGAIILDHEPGAFLFGAIKNVSVIVWRRRADTEALQRLGLAVAKVKDKYPNGRSSIHLVHDGAEPPTPEAQQAFVKLAQSPGLACVAVVFLGSGFWASCLRANSMNMVAQVKTKGFEYRQHGAIEDLATWLPAAHEFHTGVKVRSHVLLNAIRVFTHY